MKTIYKHRFTDANEMFIRGTPRHVGNEAGRDLPTIWIEHEKLLFYENKEIPMERYMFVGTGHVFNDEHWSYIGSAQCGQFVWHVYKERV